MGGLYLPPSRVNYVGSVARHYRAAPQALCGTGAGGRRSTGSRRRSMGPIPLVATASDLGGGMEPVRLIDRQRRYGLAALTCATLVPLSIAGRCHQTVARHRRDPTLADRPHRIRLPCPEVVRETTFVQYASRSFSHGPGVRTAARLIGGILTTSISASFLPALLDQTRLIFHTYRSALTATPSTVCAYLSVAFEHGRVRG